MTAKTSTFEYLLLFRGNNWTEDLSLEENKISKFTSWFERVKNSGIFKSGHRLEHNDKIVADRNAVTNDPFAKSKEAIAAFFIQADSVNPLFVTAQNGGIPQVTKHCQFGGPPAN